jgi:nucleotide-binding universal stress UspA family protein
MILICYDGSDDARCAIDESVELLGCQPATVLTVWQPFAQLVARNALGFDLAPRTLDIDKVDEASREAAKALAEEGAELAREAGFNAQPRACTQLATTAHSILAEAELLGANAIVMGSRGISGLKSILLGSVSAAVLHAADRTVIVVPSPGVAGSRSRTRYEVETAQ